jgi:hypothetical protein
MPADILYYSATPAEAQYVEESIGAKIDRYAAMYPGASSEEMYKTIKCESSFNPKAWNKNDPNGGSKGICQFQPGTFAYYSKLAGIENGDIWNVDHQLQTMAYMFSKGLQNHWSCYKMIK